MDDPASKPPRGTHLLVILVLVLSAAGLRGQDGPREPLRLTGLNPDGLRRSVTESWGTLQFSLFNQNDTARDARVTVFYTGRDDVQYARDVWVPARSNLTTLLPVGPAPPQAIERGREISMVLHDRTDGANRLILPPGEERFRSRSVLYRRREQTTAILSDVAPARPDNPDPELVAPDVLAFVRLIRQEVSLDEYVSLLADDPLPLALEAFDGIDVFVLAGNRLAADPPGRAMLRRWVLGGGRLWVMLDRVDPATVAAILGDDADVGVVDRVGLTSFQLLSGQAERPAEPAREVEIPVPFVRATPSPSDRVLVTANGWPAAFSRPLGRGKVLFTTLGGPGWFRPPAAPKSRVTTAPTPLAHDLCVPLALELHPPPEPDPVPPDVFQPMLADEIGYSVIGRGTAALILGGFVLAVAGLVIGLRKSRRPELVGWLVPATAVVAAAVFVALGERSRRAVPPTVGVAGIAVAAAGTGEMSFSGLYAVYQPSSGRVSLGSREGAALGLDTEGLDGQVRVRVQTDTDAWHWDGLSLPAGVRTGTFKVGAKVGRVAAVVRFGPNGMEGKLNSGSFKDTTDAIIWTPAKDPLVVSLAPDNSFVSTSADVLPTGQYVAGSVLTDRQQRRQSIYRQLLAGKMPAYLTGRDFLLAWAEPAEAPIPAEAGTRVVGSVLLAVPLEFERTPPNTPVTVPRGFTSFRRVQGVGQVPALVVGTFPADQRFRFQLPASVLPMRVERATLFAHVRTPSRRFSVAGFADGNPVPLFQTDGPADPVRVEITDERLLRLDENGGLHLNFVVGAALAGAATDAPWAFDILSLEIVGRTLESR